MRSRSVCDIFHKVGRYMRLAMRKQAKRSSRRMLVVYKISLVVFAVSWFRGSLTARHEAIQHRREISCTAQEVAGIAVAVGAWGKPRAGQHVACRTEGEDRKSVV